MDLSGLDKFDIKNIKSLLEVGSIQDFILRRQVLLSKGLIIIITLVVVLLSLSVTRKQARNLQTQITDLQKKIEAISKQKDVLKEAKDFVGAFPKAVPSNKLINILTDLSVKRNIQIGSISPAKTVSKSLYDLTTIDLTVSANTYQDLGFFIYDVEHLPHAIRIEKWSARLTGRPSRSPSQQKRESSSATQSNEVLLTSDLTIGIIDLKK